MDIAAGAAPAGGEDACEAADVSRSVAEANALRWSGAAGHSEEYYLKLNDPRTRRAFWMRYTLLAPAQGPPRAQVWGIAFDPHFALRATFPMDAVRRDDVARLGMASAFLEDGRAVGDLAGAGHSLRWDLRMRSTRPAVWQLPYRAFYQGSFPRTKVVGSRMEARFSGTVTVDGETLAFDDVAGHQAHLWGTRPAWEWAWAHCNAFDGGEDAVFEALTARPHLVGVVTPPLSLCYFRCGDDEVLLNAPLVLLRTRSRYDLSGWRFEARRGEWRVAATVSARPDRFVAVDYAGPSGEARYCHNTMVGALALEVSRGSRRWTLTARDTCAYEWVSTVLQGGLQVAVVDLPALPST